MRSRYGRRLEFGISLVPNRADLELNRDLARQADELGLDLVGIQDHPYQWRYVETFALIADLQSRTQRVRFFPDVANLPLRLPAMIAKQATTLGVLSNGRFELGLGAGAFWDAMGAMGGPMRAPGEAIDALEDAIHVIRAFWSGERSISYEGKHYSVQGLHPGEAPPHAIGIWLGLGRPRGLALAGRLADGWVPSSGWATPDLVPGMSRHIDEAARAAGRDPSDIRRVYNVHGTIADGPGEGLVQGPPDHWIETLSGFAHDLGFDSFVFWPSGDLREQVERFAREIAPALRASG
jgi:alkanesulfonate monooxygenase SsuD/methylene tetrahydromethanopterin reductase-like flavin-dependent oxidoreductase (luciferase family)